MKVSSCLLLVGLLPVFSLVLAQDCVEDGVPIPAAHFIQVQNGTIIDRSTNLMWKQCSEGAGGLGCATGAPERFKWKMAMERARDSRFAGYADWRLPSRREIKTLMQNRCYGLRIDGVIFPNTPATRFWTSTPAAYYPGSAWTFDFGDASIGYGTKRDTAYARLVRDSESCSPVIPGTCLPHEDRMYEPHGSVEELDPNKEIPQDP